MYPIKLFLLTATAGVLGFAAAQISVPAASAHPTGHEFRLAAHCDRLPVSERAVCASCLGRRPPHHYHPDYPPGARCRLDNGKP